MRKPSFNSFTFVTAMFVSLSPCVQIYKNRVNAPVPAPLSRPKSRWSSQYFSYPVLDKLQLLICLARLLTKPVARGPLRWLPDGGGPLPQERAHIVCLWSNGFVGRSDYLSSAFSGGGVRAAVGL
jgi:hypothetical protein